MHAEWPLLLATISLAAALPMHPVTLPGPVHTWQVTFDVSQSMDVEDVDLDGRTVSRLVLARAAAAELVRALPCGSRVGWSATVAQRTLMLTTPLETCAHYDALLATLAGVDGTLRWSQGSSIGKGLHQSLRAVSALVAEVEQGGEGDKQGEVALVMLSDGHEAPPLRGDATGFPKADPDTRVRGLLGGMGGEVAVPIPKSDERGAPTGTFWSAEQVVQRGDDPAGNEHLSRREEAHLQALSRLAGLDYLRIDTPADLVSAALQTRYASPGERAYDLRWMPLALALLALAWRFAPFGGQRVPPSQR